jgi:Rhodopirellula transposase DDE domain
VDLDEVLAVTFSLVGPHLTERQRRRLLGTAARALGYGGVSRVAQLAEASRPTVRRGAAELDQPADPRGRIRQHQGPKRRRDTDPGLLAALDRLVDPDSRGDPQSPLRWTCKSTRQLAETLTAQGHPVSDDIVGRLLKQHGYRLQRAVKTLEGAQHPDRGCPVPLPQRAGQAASHHRAAGGERGYQEEGVGRPVRQRSSGVAALRRARGGECP